MLWTLLLVRLEVAVNSFSVVVVSWVGLLCLLLLCWARGCGVAATKVLPVRCLSLVKRRSCSTSFSRIVRVKQSSLVATVAVPKLLVLTRW